MDTLRAQTNPHFLFNALHALYGSIPADAVTARKTLLNLADLFRYTLDSKSQFVSLEDEIRIVEAYLQIARLRLGERLRTSVDVEDHATSKMVPALSIQPLVENAVKHGVSAKPEGGEVRVSARLGNGSLRVEVVDNGVGFEPDDRPSSGHGLRSVERRLQLCYPESVDFRIESGSSGTKVTYSIPL